jgi:hypothetical protein
MSKKSIKKKIEAVDPIKYAHIIERGSIRSNIPERPLFGKTLKDFSMEFNAKILGVVEQIKGVWK